MGSTTHMNKDSLHSEQAAVLRISDTVPDFTCDSTKGRLCFHRWLANSWGIFLCYAADFAPVATTQIEMAAQLHLLLKNKGFKMAAMTCDTVQNHFAWMRDVVSQSTTRISIDFPLIADPSGSIAKQWGVLHARAAGIRPMLGTNSAFIIGPDKGLKLSLHYINRIGFDAAEIVRICDALVLSATHHVAMPASWPENHANVEVNGKCMEGAVFPPSSMHQEEVQRKYSDVLELPVPSGKKYLRLVKLKPQQKPWLQRVGQRLMSMCSRVPKPFIQPRYATPAICLQVRAKPTSPNGARAGPTQHTRQEQVQTEANRIVRVGDIVPNFEAQTTKGKLIFHKWIEGRWALLFTHPADFTPVCTTELGTLAMFNVSLRTKGFRVAAMSCNTLEEHELWIQDITAHFENKVGISFPVIADPRREIAKKLGMVAPDAEAKQIMFRQVYVIGPDKRVKMMHCYPATIGCSIHEILRVCDAIQLSEKAGVGIPASWPNNHEDLIIQGNSMKSAVLIQCGTSEVEAKASYPDHVKLPVPSGRDYMRMTLLGHKEHVPVCSNCISISSSRI